MVVSKWLMFSLDSRMCRTLPKADDVETANFGRQPLTCGHIMHKQFYLVVIGARNCPLFARAILDGTPFETNPRRRPLPLWKALTALGTTATGKKLHKDMRHPSSFDPVIT